MEKDDSRESNELYEEDKFKKIKFSHDCTDLMSDFSDK
jgi:hypothetical protein